MTVVERVVAAPAAAPQRRAWAAVLHDLVDDLDRGRLYARDLPDLAAALDLVLAAYRRALR